MPGKTRKTIASLASPATLAIVFLVLPGIPRSSFDGP